MKNPVYLILLFVVSKLFVAQYIQGSKDLPLLTQNSDRRLKTNLTKVQNSGTKLAQLQAYHYNWKAADSDPSLQTGLIAQEVQMRFPELVNEGENGYLSVNYIGLIPHLIESHKELKAENEELKRRLLIIEKSLKMETQTASSK